MHFCVMYNISNVCCNDNIIYLAPPPGNGAPLGCPVSSNATHLAGHPGA